MGLRQRDLEDLVYDVFEIDSYKSKMGDDADIVTLSFSVKEQAAAKDLENFLEKGYEFVLDADSTPGEQSDGTYKVFIEMERSRHAPEQIAEILDGVGKITGLDKIKYRYHKNFRSNEATIENITNDIPVDSDAYAATMQESNYKEFFNRSYLEEVNMVGDKLTIKKAYADPIAFNFVDYGPTQETLDAIQESFNANDFAEIIFLSKYVGDYNITKYGHKLAFENEGNTLVLERIVV